jgi:hypothetical protein
LWTGDGHTLDQSGHGRNGVAQGGLSYTQGEIGQAFALDGTTASVVVGGNDNDLYPQDGPFTLAAWVKVATDGTFIVASKQESGSTGSGYVIFVHAGLPVGVLRDNAGNASDEAGFGTYTSPIADGAFHHVAFVRDAEGILRIYVDGQDRSFFPTYYPWTIADWNGTNDPLSIGLPGPFGKPGAVDDLAYYNRGLSAEEIAGIFAARTLAECGNHAPVLSKPPVSINIE